MFYLFKFELIIMEDWELVCDWGFMIGFVVFFFIYIWKDLDIDFFGDR